MVMCRRPAALLLAPLLMCSLFAFLFASAAGDDTSSGDPFADYLKREQEYYDQLSENVTNKCEVHFDPESGRCAWLNDEDRYERPALKYDITENDFKCVNAFHARIFGPSCGDPKFEMIKYCAKVKFYRNTPPENGGINKENKDLLLLLIDGCMVCLESEADELRVNVSLKLDYTLMAGSFFTACDEKQIETDKFELTLGKQIINKKSFKPKNAMSKSSDINLKAKSGQSEGDDYYNEQEQEDDDREKDASCPDDCVKKELVEETIDEGHRHFATFTMPSVMLQRKCHGLFASDEAQGKFYDVLLKVEHNCDPKGKAKFEMQIPLADVIKLRKFKDNVAEVRGLYINLATTSVFQYQTLLEKGNYRVIKKQKDDYNKNAVEFGNRKK